MFEIVYSEGTVGGTTYSQNTGPLFTGTLEEAHEYLLRETHEPYIAGSGRRLTLWEVAEDGTSAMVEEAMGCDCHTPIS